MGELRVLRTVSYKKFDLVERLGGDEVFDYRDEGVMEKIRTSTGNALNITIDTTSEGKTPEQVTGCGAIEDKGGKVAIINPYRSPRPAIKVTFSLFTDLLRRVRLVRPIPFMRLIPSFSREQAAGGMPVYSKRSSLQETSSLSQFDAFCRRLCVADRSYEN